MLIVFCLFRFVFNSRNAGVFFILIHLGLKSIFELFHGYTDVPPKTQVQSM